MDNEEHNIVREFDLKLISELHLGLERQRPGSLEMTVKALSFLDNLGNNPRVADLGCGTGGQTMVPVQNIPANITGVDFLPDFINRPIAQIFAQWVY